MSKFLFDSMLPKYPQFQPFINSQLSSSVASSLSLHNNQHINSIANSTLTTSTSEGSPLSSEGSQSSPPTSSNKMFPYVTNHTPSHGGLSGMPGYSSLEDKTQCRLVDARQTLLAWFLFLGKDRDAESMNDIVLKFKENANVKIMSEIKMTKMMNSNFRDERGEQNFESISGWRRKRFAVGTAPFCFSVGKLASLARSCVDAVRIEVIHRLGAFFSSFFVHFSMINLNQSKIVASVFFSIHH